MSQEHSAEWFRGAWIALELWGDSHWDSIQAAKNTYRNLLAAAEAREAGKATPAQPTAAEVIAGHCQEPSSAERDFLGEARLAAIELANKLSQHKIAAAEVIAGAKKALEDIGAKLDQCKTHQLGGVGGQTTEQGVLATVYHRAPYMIRHDIYAAIEALAAWEAAQR